MKYLNFGTDAEKPAGTVIAFDGSEGNRAVLYKGDLAVMNESGLALIGWDGSVVFKESFSYDYPKIIQNGINIICYDIGGKEIRLFTNSNHSAEPVAFDYPISCVAASDSGNYAVVSSAKSFRSAVYICDKDYFPGKSEPLYICKFGSKYADFVDISKDGKEFLVTGHDSEKGHIVTFVSKYSTSKDDGPLFEQVFTDEIPFGVYYTESGYALVTSEAIRVFGSDDQIRSKISYSDKKLLSAKIFGDLSLITYSTEGLSGGTELEIYDKDGKLIRSASFQNALSDTLITGDTVYALAPGTLSGIGIYEKSKTVYDVPSSFSMLLADGERVILISENEARYFNSEDYNTLQ